MSIWISFLVDILASLAKAWFGQVSATNEAEKDGALQAEQNATDKANQVKIIVDAVKPLTADELQNHNVTNDPDFRD